MTEVSVKGGKGIWGMPKHQANLDFVDAKRDVAASTTCDGQLCMRIEVERPALDGAAPERRARSTTARFRGMLMKSSIYFSATPRSPSARGPRRG